jgi:transposase-like protein
MHASVKRVLRQAWELDDADKAEKLIRNLARRLERDWKGVSASILEGLDDMLTVTRLKLPRELRRSLACTNIVENVMSTVRRVCRNVKYWRSSSMALRWAAAAMQEARKGFRRFEGAQASGSSPSRSRAAKRKGRVSDASCSNRRGRIRFVTQQPLRAFSTANGTSPPPAT